MKKLIVPALAVCLFGLVGCSAAKRDLNLGDATKVATIRTCKEAVLFEFDRAVLTAKGQAVLRQAAEQIRRYPHATLTIVGHTCSMGPLEHNMNLSLNRARAVQRALQTTYGITNQMTVVGRGPNEPAKSNDTLAGRQANRRVVIHMHN